MKKKNFFLEREREGSPRKICNRIRTFAAETLQKELYRERKEKVFFFIYFIFSILMFSFFIYLTSFFHCCGVICFFAVHTDTVTQWFSHLSFSV